MRWHRSVGWRPRDLGWRVALLFMVGSTLFAVGSFPPYAVFVDARVVGVTFFVGSLFFTSAGYSQFLQVVNDGRDRFRFWGWEPKQLLWWATLVQLVGTLFFNLNTFRAMAGRFTVSDVNGLVWAPDFFGSIAFLVASHLGWLAVCGRLWRVERESADWWTALLNYLGSIFFMLSAIGAFTLDTGSLLNASAANSGTFLGAICFFLGAYLLLPAAVSRPSVGSGP
ncbi:MAG TPA: hypothetical protein VFN19_01665 [Candidatus Nanopelagicales bacterium]|nr:hypothetical protein [Candidatus Nanopelagicales bacterium]